MSPRPAHVEPIPNKQAAVAAVAKVTASWLFASEPADLLGSTEGYTSAEVRRVDEAMTEMERRLWAIARRNGG